MESAATKLQGKASSRIGSSARFTLLGVLRAQPTDTSATEQCRRSYLFGDANIVLHLACLIFFAEHFSSACLLGAGALGPTRVSTHSSPFDQPLAWQGGASLAG